MKKSLYVILVVMVITGVQVVFACGGRDISFSDNPSDEAITSKYSDNYETMMYYSKEGKLLFNKNDVVVSKKTADHLIKDFVDSNYAGWEEIAYESFDLEHGRVVYMYSVHIPGFTSTYHVGPVQFLTDHLHLHIDAITGEIFGVGCGGGPGAVVESSQITLDRDGFDWDDVLPNDETYFYTEFVIPVGSIPELDGDIGEKEWDDAYFTRVSSPAIDYSLGYYLKIVDSKLYLAIRSPNPKWIALMFKDSPHHGMLGEFKDIKLLSTEGISDYSFTRSGIVPDELNDVKGFVSKQGSDTIYELEFPLKSEDGNDVAWQLGDAYQLGILMGDSEKFEGLTRETALVLQETARLKEQRDYDFITINNNSKHSHDEENSYSNKIEKNNEKNSFLSFWNNLSNIFRS